MVFYHLFYSMSSIFSISVGTVLINIFSPFQPLVASLFIFISGISSYLSKSNLKRGLKLFFISLVISVVTYLIMPEQVILFGILHLLSVSILLFAALQKFLERIPILCGFITAIILFVFTYGVMYGFLGVLGIRLIDIPDFMYNSDMLFALGFASDSFFSSDYFPILPYIFMFFAGTFIGRIVKKEQLPAQFYKKHSNLFSFLGRHTLIIYIVHQPVILFLLFVVEYFTK